MSSLNRCNFASLFFNLDDFTSFPCLIGLARTSIPIFNMSGENRHPCLFLPSEKKAPLIVPWVFHKWSLLCCDMLVTQLCLMFCDPMDCSPPDSPGPWGGPGKSNGVSSHSLLQRLFLTQDGTHVFCISCFGRQIPYY